MARTVRWAEVGLADLEEVLGYIARDSRYYAASFAAEVSAAARSLATTSERGRVVREFADPTIREIFIRRYRLVYRVTEDIVLVVALIHGARDFAAAWGERR